MTSSKVPVAIVVAGLILSGAVYLSMGGGWPSFSLGSGTRGDPSLVRPVGAEDHILGNPAAPVTIVTYCDFESEYCKGFSGTMNQLVATAGAGGEVAWVYREFPLTDTHEHALAHARAAECAAEVAGNDAFWRFADALFAAWPAEPGEYGEVAERAGIPGDAFAACYASAAERVDARITADRENALAVGAIGTPYSLLLARGKEPMVLDGAYPYDALRQIVDEALGNAP